MNLVEELASFLQNANVWETLKKAAVVRVSVSILHLTLQVSE